MSPFRVEQVCFADDLTITAHTGRLVEQGTNPVLRDVAEWMSWHELALALHKSEAMVLTRWKAYDRFRIYMEGVDVLVVKVARYLEVLIDGRRSFTAQVDKVSAKTMRTAVALDRLMM